jgi:hypothetical protein
MQFAKDFFLIIPEDDCQNRKFFSLILVTYHNQLYLEMRRTQNLLTKR